MAWVLQSMLIVFAVVLPLLQTVALPRLEILTPVGAPPGAPPPKAPNPVRDAGHSRPTPVIDAEGLHAPVRIPQKIDRTADPQREVGTAEPPCSYCIVGGIPGEPSPGPGILRNLTPQPAEATPPPKPASRVVISAGVQQGFLVHQVQPVYPAIARTARVEGTVVLAAVINRDGTIQNLHSLSGHPMLVQAALDAVKQWRYRPYMLSGQPVEVETQISVIFTLAH